MAAPNGDCLQDHTQRARIILYHNAGDSVASISEVLFKQVLQQSSEVAFRQIVAAVNAGTCNLFMGAAVHGPPDNHPVYKFPADKLPPIGKGLARILASDPDYKNRFPDEDLSNLARVAQTYESLRTRQALVAKVREVVEEGKEPSPVLRALAELDFPVIVTTNYDTLFQKALGYAGKVPFLSTYQANEGIPQPRPVPDMPPTRRPTPQKPFFYKMHGDIETGDSLVLTEEDYIQFILRMRDQDPLQSIPNTVLEAIKGAPTLFVGYSLRDYNLRVLLKRLRQIDPGNVPGAYSIDLSPDPIIWDVWWQQRRYVNFVSLNVWDFVPRLYREVKGKEMPA